MAGGRASFEVQIYRDSRWYLGDHCDSEAAAKDSCKKMLAKPGCNGVRILKNYTRGDGSVTESVIHTEMREQKEVKATIVPIEDAPYCKQVSDYYGPASRGTINRLCRKYLEQVYLTPTELMHNYKAMKKIQEADSLFPSAVQRVADLQVRETKEPPKARSEEIYKAVTKIAERARKIEALPDLPKLTNDDFDGLLTRISRIAPEGQTDLYSLVALSKDLVEHRNWLGKLDRLVKLVRADQREESLALLDGIFADLFGVPAALQDVLGEQRNLGEAICSIADLYEGRFDASKSDAREQMAVITPLIAAGKLEGTRAVMLDRLLRQLGGGQPLNRLDPTKERETFREVAVRLIKGSSLIGGPAAAEALTRRFVYLQEEGGQTGLRLAIGGVVSALADSLYSVVFLLQLAASPLGVEQSGEIVALLGRMIGRSGMDDLAPPKWPVKDRLLRLTRIYDLLAGATELPEDERQKMLTGLDDVLMRYVLREKIIDKLDDQAVHLRDRSIRLIEFCAAKVLPQGSKALQAARDRVVGILKQPNFELHFIEGQTDPAKCEQMLRGFHALLLRAGFK